MNPQNRPERMGSAPVFGLIFSFALPSIVGMLANALYNIVDRIFVGQVVGPEGLAAAGICFSFMMFNFGISLLFGVGSATLISTALGEGKSDRAEKILGTTVGSIFLVSCVIAAFSYWNLEAILRLSGAGESLIAASGEYMRVIIWGIPYSGLAFALNFCIRAEGRPAFSMGTQLIGAFANIVLDALFIVVLGMGVKGAALGTILAQLISALWVAWFYFRRLGVLRLKTKNFIPNMTLLYKIVSLGLSPCLTEMFFSFSLLLFNRTLSAHGGDLGVSAFGAFMGWDSLLFLPVVGIGEAVQTLFAYNFGARLLKRLLEILKWALSLATVYYILSAFSVYFLAEHMMRLFTSDPKLLKIAAEGAIISYGGVVFAGITLMTISFFQGLGKAGMCLFLNLARQILFLIPAILILPRLFGLPGVWGCFIIMDVGGGCLGLCLLLRECKRLSIL
ncbi:MATE family efflux transporter [Synergistales bacterium]|nr:MATE family efflux transporter [Synergistales bacterium]